MSRWDGPAPLRASEGVGVCGERRRLPLPARAARGGRRRAAAAGAAALAAFAPGTAVPADPGLFARDGTLAAQSPDAPTDCLRAVRELKMLVGTPGWAARSPAEKRATLRDVFTADPRKSSAPDDNAADKGDTGSWGLFLVDEPRAAGAGDGGTAGAGDAGARVAAAGEEGALTGTNGCPSEWVAFEDDCTSGAFNGGLVGVTAGATAGATACATAGVATNDDLGTFATIGGKKNPFESCSLDGRQGTGTAEERFAESYVSLLAALVDGMKGPFAPSEAGEVLAYIALDWVRGAAKVTFLAPGRRAFALQITDHGLAEAFEKIVGSPPPLPVHREAWKPPPNSASCALELRYPALTLSLVGGRPRLDALMRSLHSMYKDYSEAPGIPDFVPRVALNVSRMRIPLALFELMRQKFGEGVQVIVLCAGDHRAVAFYRLMKEIFNPSDELAAAVKAHAPWARGSELW